MTIGIKVFAVKENTSIIPAIEISCGFENDALKNW